MTTMTTPDLCDKYPDIVKVVSPFLKHYGGKKSFSGQIVTIKCFEDNSWVKKTLGENGEGKVLVVDGEGSLGCALLGDQLAALASENKWQGVIVNGCVRDVGELQNIDLGVMAKAIHPKRSIKRNQGEVNMIVKFGHVDFVPHYYVYADENGVIVTPNPLT